MSDLNNVVLAGNLVRDTEGNQKQTVANNAIAVNRTRKEGDDYVNEATFVDIKFIGKQAETAIRHLSKGRKIFVQGRLEQERWEKDGKNFSKLVVLVSDFGFLDGAKKSESNDDNSTSKKNNH